MQYFSRSILFCLVVLFTLAACGGGGGSSPPAETGSKCVVGTSTIGDCEI